MPPDERERETIPTTPTETLTPEHAEEKRTRTLTRAAGALYLITFLASIPALLLIGPVLDDADYLIGPGADTRVLWGCLLDVVTALACVGTAVALFPVGRRADEVLALGFVAAV